VVVVPGLAIVGDDPLRLLALLLLRHGSTTILDAQTLRGAPDGEREPLIA
jgi:hypothetical protein